MTPESILFFVLAIGSVVAALAMVFSRNPVHAAMCMVSNFAMVAIIYLTLQATFLAAVQILVYAGAIMVLFLFVVMLFGPEPAPLWEHLPGQRPLALIFSIILLVGLVTAVNVPALTGTPGTLTEAEIATVGNPTLIGLALYQRYAVPFEVTSVLLLVAMIGAVVLAKRDRSETVGSTSDAAIAATDTSLQRIPADAASAAD